MIKPVLQNDALVSDVVSAAGDAAGSFRLWWLGQSGFLLQCENRHLLFDPYLSDSLTTKYTGTAKPHVRVSERVVAPERLAFVNAVTSTHAHTDHLDRDTLVPLGRAALAGHHDVNLVLPAAIHDIALDRTRGSGIDLWPMEAGDAEELHGFGVHAVPAAHDQLAVDDRGRNLYLGYVVWVGPWCVYHAGDGVVFDGLAERVRALGPVDVAILPINGKVGNMGGRDAARLANDIGARLVIPCHYDMFEFNTADPRDEFVPECERIGQPYRVLRLGERFSSAEIL